MSSLVRSCFYLQNNAKHNPIASHPEKKILIRAFALSHSDYCNALYTRLTKASPSVWQKAAARLLTEYSKLHF